MTRWADLEAACDGVEPPPVITVLTAAGTWATPAMGYPADVARALDAERFTWRPINYPAVGFLNPDPNTSYNESVAMGVAEGLRMLETVRGEYDLVGYSQGAEVVVRIADAMLERPPRRIVTFGSPCRPPGRTKLGNNPPGSGISRFYTPPELRSRTWDIVRDKGEMYGCAPDDTYLPEFYQLFVQAETSLPFAAAVFEFLTPYLFGAIGAISTGNPLALIGTVDVPKAMRTAMVVADFVGTQAHTSYHLPAPEYGGRTGVQIAVDALQR